MSRSGRQANEGAIQHPAGGFTLLELAVMLLVVGILLGYALPSYHQYLLRGQRAEAVRLLLSAAACQERIRASAGAYDTTRCVDGSPEVPYSLRIEPANTRTSAVFRLIAEPVNPRSDDPCGTLTLDQAGHRGITGQETSLAPCWGGR